MKIPETFSIFGKTVTVRCDEQALVVESDAGHAGYRNETIVLLPAENMDRFSRQSREQTFCHEVVHHWMHALNLDDLRNDERTVDNLGSLLHQFLVTQTGEVK